MATRSILLVTPPFVQPNSPYPATMYLCGYLNRKGYTAWQADLSIMTLCTIFSSGFLSRVFERTETVDDHTHFFLNKKRYIETIDPVLAFLQGKDPHLAARIVTRSFLPEGPRFNNLGENHPSPLEKSDYARMLATLYIEDLFDFYRAYCDSDFQLTRYAESLCVSLTDYAPLSEKMRTEPTPIEHCFLSHLDNLISKYRPDIIGFTIPFPGNLLPAMRCAHHIKRTTTGIMTIAGGGYVTTELYSIRTIDFFDLFDFLIFDSSEKPLEQLILDDYTCGESIDGIIYQHDGSLIRGKRLPYFIDKNVSLFPDYTGIDVDSYISLIDTYNPMIRLWNEGFWNKLTIAYGCYWSQCAFCDTSLDYIHNYRPLDTQSLITRIRSLISSTGSTGFHFTDEAAPPGQLKRLAEELICQALHITYWTNIRFEKSFTTDLARLLAYSGCIAVSGGIEVASNRILKLMKKGVRVGEIIKSAGTLSQAGILVHAYLMYGFPTQTCQETVDSLEIVRQLFLHGCIDSAYYHRFSLTAHSDVFKNSSDYCINASVPQSNFACNDLPYQEEETDETIGSALACAIDAFMRREELERPSHTWFTKNMPKTTLSPDYVEEILNRQEVPGSLAPGKSILIVRIPRIIIHSHYSTLSVMVDGDCYRVSGKKSDGTASQALFCTISPHEIIKSDSLLDRINNAGVDTDVFYSSEIWFFIRELCLIVI